MFYTWLIYALITSVLALLAFKIPENSKGILKAIQGIASFCFVLVGITFLIVTVVATIDYIAPNFGSGSDSGEEYCVPDPFGGC